MHRRISEDFKFESTLLNENDIVIVDKHSVEIFHDSSYLDGQIQDYDFGYLSYIQLQPLLKTSEEITKKEAQDIRFKDLDQGLVASRNRYTGIIL